MTDEPKKKSKIDQAIENALAILGALAIGVIAGGWAVHNHYKPIIQAEAQKAAVKAEQAAIEAFKRQAVKDRAGEWDASPDGSPRFRWAACNQFGIKK